MSDDTKVLLIPKIENGIVIDHLPAGLGLKVLEVIHRTPEMRSVVVTVGLNYVSSKLGRKDLLKLQAEVLPERVLQHLAMLCPGASVKRIKDYAVEKKYVLMPPQVIVGLARCRNPGCVTHDDRSAPTRFTRVDATGHRFRCAFCERVFPLAELELLPQ